MNKKESKIKEQIDSRFEDLKNIIKNNNWPEGSDNLFNYLKKKLNNYSESYSTKQHDTNIIYLNGDPINIDKKICPLMTELWKADILTTNSCEDNVPRGYIWIEFKSQEDFKNFIEIIFVGESYDNNVYQRSISTFPCPGNKWKFKINIFGDDYFDDYENKNNNETVLFYPSVRFPQEDLEYVYNKIKKYNDEKLFKMLN